MSPGPTKPRPRPLGTLPGVAAACTLGLSVPGYAEPLLPDLVSTADQQRQLMYGGTFDWTSDPGRVLYRFNTAVTNLGQGPFEVFEITNNNTQVQDVYQRVHDSTGGFVQTLMGSFSVSTPPPFGHLNLEALALYNLREVLPGDGVGDVVASHAKTSHAVVDSILIDGSLPAAPNFPVYNSAFDNPLGISVGYADLYGKGIPTQRIDVTGIPSGQYWLEVVIDPRGFVQETDETNNTTRILVDLVVPPGEVTTAGDYDASGQVDQGDLDLVLQNWGDDVNVTGIPNTWVNDRPAGLIEQTELDGVLQNWGDVAAPDFGGSSVPEPATLVALGLPALALRRR